MDNIDYVSTKKYLRKLENLIQMYILSHIINLFIAYSVVRETSRRESVKEKNDVSILEVNLKSRRFFRTVLRHEDR